MAALGISIYPEKSTFDEDKCYLDNAKKYGFSRIFMNLLLFVPKNMDSLVKRLEETISYGNELGFSTYIDINPFTLKALDLEPTDLDYFAKLGVKGVRLDMGFTGKEEAEMTHNPWGLDIEINMSNDDHYLQRIFDYNPNRFKLVGCHNFFPQAYTGLSTDYFLHCSKRFTEKNLHTAAFVTSQVGKIGPWPLHEGICTLEEHRHLPIEKQVKHLKLLGAVDDILIGNAYASEEELRKMSLAFLEDKVLLSVIPNSGLTNLEREIIEKPVHSYRGDRSKYMIRSSSPRLTYYKQSIPPNSSVRTIQKGDVLILNENYGQYKGEVQIALEERPADSRVNIVGKIVSEDFILLDALQPYTNFSFQWDR